VITPHAAAGPEAEWPLMAAGKTMGYVIGRVA
jgi:hypothetical protein